MRDVVLISALVMVLLVGCLAAGFAAHFCPQCGAALPDGAKFCPNCGAKVEQGNAGATAKPQATVMHLAFDGNLSDDTGNGHDAQVQAPEFAAGQKGQALKSGATPAIVPNSPDLQLAPGLRIECWVRLGAPVASQDMQKILVKEHEYMLRVDPAVEGGRFAFFVYLNGAWDPRVNSEIRAEPGKWYHLVGAWDGKVLSLEVNGARTEVARTGVPEPDNAPVSIGVPGGLIDEVRIDNPLPPGCVLRVPLDGNLRDESGNGRDAQVAAPEFVEGNKGKALRIGTARAVVPDCADLQLAAGLRVECWVQLPATPPEEFPKILIKQDEYMMCVTPQAEGGTFSFFVLLDGGWEPRAKSAVRAEPGKWYHLVGAWDGEVLSLEVNGERTTVFRSGVTRPTNHPFMIGDPGYLMSRVRIDNPRLPVLSAQDLTQEHAILRAGRPENICMTVRNAGADAPDVTAVLELGPGATCVGADRQSLGPLPSGATKTVVWAVRADAAVTLPWAQMRFTANGCTPATQPVRLAFFPAQDEPPGAGIQAPSKAGAVTYYVDSAAGRNSNTGTSPASPWQDFTNINGKTLGPGERLLIKRGSVINQELVISAHGTPDNWAEIGAYGTGARPMIRRNWDIIDRCALVRDPDYLHIHSLTVCYAAKGLIVSYDTNGHSGLVIEDCIAHHIEGGPPPNGHGIPEWQGRSMPGSDQIRDAAGFGVAGNHPRDVVIRNCEMFQTSDSFAVGNAEAVTLDRLYVHDNYIANTSGGYGICNVTRSYLRNAIFDASAWQSSTGTTELFLGEPTAGLIISNCTFRNAPDAGCPDETGIDFESMGSGFLIDHCTFENNAGAAIEVLGTFGNPQVRNVEIVDSRFIGNNAAHKPEMPGAIYVSGWGDTRSVCSSGMIHDNVYTTTPGTELFASVGPLKQRPQWALGNNTAYATAQELRAAKPLNEAPMVRAGSDIRTDSKSVHLSGSVTDDGLPGTTPLAIRWEVLEGPGSVTFRDEGAADTWAEFGAPGDYVLRLVGDDSELWRSDMVAVHILPPGASVAKAWEFNTPLDKEGWSEVNPGTCVQKIDDPVWPSTAQPVKYVGGGYYVLAIQKSPDAHILSADNLGVDLAQNRTITIRFQNHTPATRMRFRFTTDADAAWDDAKSKSCDVVANDNGPRVYTVDMSAVAGWKGHLKQLRLDIATGDALTGTCRFDYIWIGRL